MKTLLKIIIFIVIALGCYHTAIGQERLSVNGYVDGRLMLLGDDKGNDAGTINAVFKMEWQGNDVGYGYLFVFPQYEFFDSSFAVMHRYSVGVGHTFYTPVENLEVSPQVSYGRLVRFKKGFSSFDVGGDISYKVSANVKISLLASVTERKDIPYIWGGPTVWRFNLYGGLKYLL